VGEPVRCEWAVRYPELIAYHDEVWGRPTRDDRAIFAAYGQCVLHAGLLWTALLKKRAIFAAAFDDWNVAKIAHYDGAEVERLLQTEGMIRNFQKINAIIHNAARFIEVQREFGSFGAYVWRFVDNEPLACVCTAEFTCNVGRPEAERLAADLKRRGFKFAGPATAYGLMEDIGMVNDHDRACFRSATEAGRSD
jgi:DNA-3-methyladenine glycosylase I